MRNCDWKNSDSYLFNSGFDTKEYGEGNCWHWATDSHALIGIDYRNERKASIIELNCELMPPPTLHSCRVNLEINGVLVDSVEAPQEYKMQFWAQPGKIHEICFWVENEPTSVEGDSRKFFFLLLNPTICSRELEIPQDKSLFLLQRDYIKLLQRFIEICHDNKLNYMAIYGTLLGAIRHTGFVPWDDDLDIAMPRSDYNRFLSIAKQSDEESDFYVLTSEDYDDYFVGGYARFGMMSSTFVKSGEVQCNYPHGVTMDLFPLDYVPEDYNERINQQKKILRWQRALMTKMKNYSKKMIFSEGDTNNWRQARQDATVFSRKKLLQLLQKEFETCKLSSKVAILGRYYANKNYSVYPVSVLTDFEIIRFDSIDIQIPKEFEKCLVADYGRQFLLLPYDGAKQHSGVYINACDCRTGISRCIDTPIDVERILLLGKVDLILKYMEADVYGHKVVDAIDEDSIIQGRVIHGVSFVTDGIDMLLEHVDMLYDAVIVCSQKYLQHINRIPKIIDYYIYVN